MGKVPKFTKLGDASLLGVIQEIEDINNVTFDGPRKLFTTRLVC